MKYNTMWAMALVILVMANPALLSVLEVAENDSEQNNSATEVLERPMESKLENITEPRNLNL